MVELQRSRWEGVVTEGELSGCRVEVRGQRLPWALYVLAFSVPGEDEEPIIGFAVGRQRLASYLTELGIEVTWEDGRGPLAPERDRAERVPSRRLGRRRSTREVDAARVRPPKAQGRVMAQLRRSSRR